ncbi:MAG TPA: large-conductance mechanosensitive channel protein MscL, partial [Rhodospirillales bacterium]|nr:large-conductance mechanosensitive channel protein MscL [Rhodospirillales bacterium]
GQKATRAPQEEGSRGLIGRRATAARPVQREPGHREKDEAGPVSGFSFSGPSHTVHRIHQTLRSGQHMSIVTEFKEFAMKGNVLDMAVGVVIGAAFGKIVSSLVSDVITPMIGKAVGGVNFKDLAISLGTDPAGAPILVKYGMFLQNIFDFVIIAAAIFMAVKAINRLKTPPPPAADPAPAPDVVLLGEIRDLLKKQ